MGTIPGLRRRVSQCLTPTPHPLCSLILERPRGLLDELRGNLPSTEVGPSTLSSVERGRDRVRLRDDVAGSRRGHTRVYLRNSSVQHPAMHVRDGITRAGTSHGVRNRSCSAIILPTPTLPPGSQPRRSPRP